jgi:hypothetical protein
MSLKTFFNWTSRDLFAFGSLLKRPTNDKMELVRNWHSEVARARTSW